MFSPQLISHSVSLRHSMREVTMVQTKPTVYRVWSENERNFYVKLYYANRCNAFSKSYWEMYPEKNSRRKSRARNQRPPTMGLIKEWVAKREEMERLRDEEESKKESSE